MSNFKVEVIPFKSDSTSPFILSIEAPDGRFVRLAVERAWGLLWSDASPSNWWHAPEPDCDQIAEALSRLFDPALPAPAQIRQDRAEIPGGSHPGAGSRPC